jgi:dihydroorotate dehydrogenase
MWLKLKLLKIVRHILLQLSPEIAHNIAIFCLKHNLVPATLTQNQRCKLDKPLDYIKKNPIGLAAGFDKNADCIKNLANLGFDFIEVGTCTPKPQYGNSKPRLFRLKEQKTIINRFGFNSKGKDYFVKNLKKAMCLTNRPLIGANIGKNKNTQSIESDYLIMLEAVYNYCDYVAINISSPNTLGLRDIQGEESLEILLKALQAKRLELQNTHGVYRPLFLKIAPDITKEQVIYIVSLSLKYKIDCLIVANTTIKRDFEALQISKFKSEQGGLSGNLLKDLSFSILKDFLDVSKGLIPIISAGGIDSSEDVKRRLALGAIGVQIYSALIFEGFELIHKIKNDTK